MKSSSIDVNRRPMPPPGGLPGMIRRGLRGRRREQARALEAAADRRELVLVRLDEREAVAADGVAGQLERGLDRDRVRLDLQQLVRRAQLFVDRARSLDVALSVQADHLRDPSPPE